MAFVVSFFFLKVSFRSFAKNKDYRKRRSKLRHNRSREAKHHTRQRGPIDKPSYQYGMVGQPNSDPFSLEPQHSSPGVQNAFGNSSGTAQVQGPPQSMTGQTAFGNDGGLGQASGQVGGQASGQVGGQASGQVGGQVSGQVGGQFGGQVGGPLVNDGGLGQASGLPGAMGTDGGLGHTVAGASHTGDPNLVPLITGLGITAATAGAAGLYAAATSSRSSSSRPSTGSSSQVLDPFATPTPTISRGGYHLPTRNTSHGYGQAPAGLSAPPNNITNKLSVSSVASTSSAYSHSSSAGNSSPNAMTDVNSGSFPPVLRSMEASSHQQQRHQSFGHVASLQVTNNADYEYNPYADVGSSFMGGASSSHAQEAPIYENDEQGRPLNYPQEKVPFVHLDGALYQEPPDNDHRSGYEPPAYIE